MNNSNGQSTNGEDESKESNSLVSAVMKEFPSMRKDKNEDLEDVVSPYAGLEKSSVLQEASAAFNDPQVVKLEASRCCVLITKLLYLLAIGEKFEGRDAESVFFAVTKLFQSTNTALRRMTYLFIKEVAESTEPENVIIVIQSLTKDMNSNVDLYRANAIRVLCKIIDASILGQIDRYIKEAVVDKNPLVSASSLICGNQMAYEPAKLEILKRWSNEVQEAVNSNEEMVQFHALALLYQVKKHDRLAVGRIISQYQKASLNSPYAMILLIRYLSKLLHEDTMGNTDPRAAYEFMELCLHHKNEMVILEAARAMCRLPEVGPQDILPAVTVLQMFLSSQKPSVRFASVRTLNELAMKHPNIITRAESDMEQLIVDQNKSIATLAITTLLKISSEGSVDKLMKQISGFITDIADEFKIVVVRAVRSLCLRYPTKHRVLLNFLSSILRDEGGFEFKKVVVDTILYLIEQIPSCKQDGLFHLCEFIEDCEFTSLSAQILHVIGEQGPTTQHPAKYIRFIYNRIILENAHVRAAAVSALGKFGAQVSSLLESITVLLRRSLTDDDDEVRDRAIVCLYALESISKNPDEVVPAKSMLIDPLPVNPSTLNKALEVYEMHPSAGRITFDALPIIEDDEIISRPLDDGAVGGLDALETSQVGKKSDNHNGAANNENNNSPVANVKAQAMAQLLKVPEFAQLGTPFRTTKAQKLTESEAEYLVSCIKHIFDEHIILQFNVVNTLEDQLLKNISAIVEDQECDEWEVLFTKPIESLKHNDSGQTYILLKRPHDLYQGIFSVDLKFNILECDPSTGEAYDEDDEGEEEEFPVEPLDLETTDFVAKTQINNFKTAWEAIGKSDEVLAKYDLPHYKSLKDAISAVIDFLGLRPCEGTDSVALNASSQNVLLSGNFLGGTKVLARSIFALGEQGVQLKIAIRSEDGNISQLLMDCIQ